jgi:hypothetical protein
MNAIMTAGQCGGQWFESPQLHPSEQGVPPREERLAAFPASSVGEKLDVLTDRPEAEAANPLLVWRLKRIRSMRRRMTA